MGVSLRILEYFGIPFGYSFKFYYGITGHYLWALALFCVSIKLLMLPIDIRQQRAMQKQALLRPEEQKIREKYSGKTDQDSQLQLSQEIMKLYSDSKVNPASGCLPSLIQIPVMFSLYTVITKPLTYLCRLDPGTISAIEQRVQEFSGNAKGITQIQQIQMISVMKANPAQFSDLTAGIKLPEFGVFSNSIDLSQVPSVSHLSWVLLVPLFTLLTSYFAAYIQRKIMDPQPIPVEGEAAASMKAIQAMMPLMSVWITFSVPAIIGVYWIMQNLIGTAQQYILKKLFPVGATAKRQL